jgi:hypothetical protein
LRVDPLFRHQGGDHVKAGFYFNTESWEITTISGTEGGTLDGGAAARYLRIPVLAMLLFAPLMGALFAIFLPFIGIAMVAQYLAVRAWAGARHASHALLVALGPAWQPSAAHLAGAPDKTKPEAPAPPAPEAQARLDALEREIVEKKSER